MDTLLLVILCLVAVSQASTTDYASDPSIQLFQQYLRINTTSGNDLTPAVNFWKQLAAEENVPINVYEYVTGNPVVVIKWAGTDPSLPSIMLNSHMDVVPADVNDGWTYPPFEAQIDENGNIYGRGTQDMKSVGIQYFLALRRLKANNVSWLRTIYMTLMPDEELGGDDGMVPFLESQEFADMNVGIELDEGTSFDLPLIAMFYQDKSVWQFRVDCHGIAAHGSTFPTTNSTAIGKCLNVMNRFFEFRDEQYEISAKATVNNAGSYTSVNLNKLNGGTAMNIIPQQVSIYFDVRLATHLNEDNFEAQLNQWIEEAGTNITLTFIIKNPQSPATVITDSNPYWVALSNAANKLGVMVLPAIPPGSTDARYVRNHGIPAFGFSPMPNTPLLLHAVDEHLNSDVFLKGIDIYEEFIISLANIPGDQTSSDPSVYLAKTTE